MSVHAAQLNKNGYVTKTTLSSSKVASGTGANRGEAAGLMRKSGYSTYSSLGLFTKSQPVGRQIQAMKDNAIASRANRPAGQSWAYTPRSTVQEVQQFQVQAPDTGTKWWQAALYAAPTLVGALGAGMELFSGPKSNPTGNNVTTPPASSVPSSSSSEVQGLLNNLRAAGSQDYNTLNNAITEANSKLSELHTMTPQIQAEAKSAQDLKGEAQTKVTEAGKGVQSAKEQLGKANTKVESSKLGVTKAKSDLNTAMEKAGISNEEYRTAHSNTVSAEARSESAKAKHTETTAALGKAQTSLSSAESKLSSTPKTRDDGNGHQVPNEPAYSDAQRAVEQAKTALEQAKKADEAADKEEKAAADALTKAKEAEETAKSQLDDAQKAVADSKEGFKEQEAGLKDAEKAFDNAKTEQKKCDDNLELAQQNEESVKEWAQSITEQAGKLQKHLKDVDDLQKGIDAANEQLKKLEAQEAKDLAKTEKKMAKNNDTISTLNKNNNFFDAETSKSEQKDFAKMTAAEEENKTLAAKGEAIKNNQQLSKAYQNVIASKQGELKVGGHTYYSNGSNIFIMDGKPISAQAYLNAQLMAGK